MILFGLAVAPGIAIALYVYFRDKYEKEPLSLLLKSAVYGAISVFAAALIELWLGSIIPNPVTLVEIAIVNFIFIGFVEEYIKYLVLMRVAYSKPDFNEPFDGITYAVMVSMGFATVENIFYVLEGGLNVALARIFTAVPAHAAFAVLMGYFVGLAKFSHHNRIYLALGVIIATMFHGAYDFFLTVNNIELIALGALFALVSGVLLSLKAMKLLNQNSPFRYSVVVGNKFPEPPSSETPL